MQSEKNAAQKVTFGRCAGRNACSGHEIMIRFVLLRLKRVVDLLAPLRALTPGGLLGLGDIIGALSLGVLRSRIERDLRKVRQRL